MTRSASGFFPEKEFDDFLFAPIGEDKNGMLLSVLSALVRMDIDPWQEAAKLSRMPGKTAIERLAVLIAALPEMPSAHRDPGTIAARLIALLPSRVDTKAEPRRSLPSVRATIHPRAASIAIVVIVLGLGAQYILASTRSPVQSDDAHAPASGTALPHTPTPNARR